MGKTIPSGNIKFQVSGIVQNMGLLKMFAVVCSGWYKRNGYKWFTYQQKMAVYGCVDRMLNHIHYICSVLMLPTKDSLLSLGTF